MPETEPDRIKIVTVSSGAGFTPEMNMVIYFGLTLATLVLWVFFFGKAKKIHEARFRYETMVLKPLSATLTLFSFNYLFRQNWWVAAIFLVLTFLIGTIGQSAHPNLTVTQLAKATPEEENRPVDDGQEVELSDNEAFALARIALFTSTTAGISVGVLSYHYGLSLWASFPMTVVSALIFAAVSTIAVIRLGPTR